MALLRRSQNRRLADTVRWWAFAGSQYSPGATAYYAARRAAGDGHEAVLCRLAGKLLGQLHHCLEHSELYRDDRAWPQPQAQAT